MKKQSLTISALAVFTGLLVPAHATPILTGDLFFTTFQDQSGNPSIPQSTNVWKVSFVYDSAPSLTLSAPVIVKQLTGADGLIFDPNDATNQTLIIGEQNSNKIAQMGTSGLPLLEAKADGSAAIGFGLGQAYGIIATPDKTKVLALPNDVSPNPTSINVAPLNPLGNGVSHCVGVTDHQIVGVDFDKNGVAHYGTAPDQLLGSFGILDNLGAVNPTCFTATPSIIVDDVNHTAVQGKLPAHGVTYDAFSNCYIISGGNQIWQLCPDATIANEFHIVAKVATPVLINGFGCSHPVGNPSCDSNNWDQTSASGGHLFAANNNGDLLFIDYKATGNIGTATFISPPTFLSVALDDLVNGGGVIVVPGGCPATKGFWHDPSKHGWPDAGVSVGGVTYEGAPLRGMIIGGQHYTQAQLLSLMPSAAAKGSGYVITGSQLIAAVLNIAAGGQHSAAVDAAIKTANNLLAVDARMVGTAYGVGLAINYTLPANNDALVAASTALDNYNSDVGLTCSEASGLTTGSQKPPQPSN